jgi:hypothetical protein
MSNMAIKRIFILLSCVWLNLSAQSNSNDDVINYVEKHGAGLAPSYHQVVCTDFLIKVLKKFIPIDKRDYQRIQIITSQSINELIKAKSEVPNGVCYALNSSGKGKYVTLQEAKAGDFVQFWKGFLGFYTWGHCGVLDHIDHENHKIYMYSSHPQTDGFGLHVFDLPDYIVFARLK